ncbi:ketopantoate reductase family protein [Desulfobacterota bacterium M19]
MKITIVGPGALGCLLAALLSRAGHRIFILDYKVSRAARLNREGVCLSEGGRRQAYTVRATTDPAATTGSETLLLCVKSADVISALARTAPLIKEGPLLVSMQNGLRHLPVLRNLPDSSWALAVTAMGATLTAPGVIHFGGAGFTSFGFLKQTTDERLAVLVELFNAAGLAAGISPDIEAAVWDKLLINVGINALTAIYNCPNGKLPVLPETREIMRLAVLEAAAVAEACGVKISSDPVGRALAVCRATENNISSMLQDVRLGRNTEIEAINGEIVRLAATFNIPAPVNKRLTTQVLSISTSRPGG